MGYTRGLAAAGLLACAAALATAYEAEHWLGLVPCAFCLLERQPYRIGLLLSALALALPRVPARAALWLLVVVFLTGAGVSAVHVGVEQHWWPDPLPACSAPNFTGMSAVQHLAAMPARPAKPCEDPDYLIPSLPISMTQMGLAYALAISAGLAICLITNTGRRIR